MQCERSMHTSIPCNASISHDASILCNKKDGTELAKKIEEASMLRALFEVFGLGFFLGMLGFNVTKTVDEDEPARVEVETEEESDSVVADTNVADSKEESELVDIEY